MVSVARRNLFQEKTRLLISTAGVAFALLLVLSLDGVLAGSLNRITAYINNTKADGYLAQPGVRTMHMSTSALPLSKVDEVEQVAGVREVVPILYTTNPVVAGERRSLAYVIGFDPARGRGGPWELRAGSEALGPREAVLDAEAAATLDVGLGDDVLILGAPFRVRGLSAGTSTITNSVVFVRFDDFAALRRMPSTASYLLIWFADSLTPEEGVRRVAAQVGDVQAMTRSEFAGEEERVVRDMSAQIMVVMNGFGFAIGLAAVALTIYTLTLSKVREYGVLKALGAGRPWLYRAALEQAFWSVGIGAVVAVALALGLSLAFSVLVPNTPLAVEAASVLKVLMGAAAISLLSAGIPIGQIARVDPAQVFRR
ncbi:MAG: ABC transporter permease [Thermoleophilia bacterium]|nr:ABC transporter permease [Thermoleophilia bacterium]